MKMKIKKLLPGIILVFFLAAPAMAQTTNRIATIDLSRVLAKYWKRDQAEAVLAKQKNELEKEMKARQDDFNKLKTDYNNLVDQAKDPTLATEERDKRKAAAEAKFMELKKCDQDNQLAANNIYEQLDLTQQHLSDSLLHDIREAVSARAKTAGYFLVVDASSSAKFQSPVVLYSSGENDITDEILNQLNAAAPASSNPLEPKTPDKDKSK